MTLRETAPDLTDARSRSQADTTVRRTPVMTVDVLAWPFTEGETVVDGKYLIKHKLAVGGMGRIYVVEHLGLGKLCVMKLLQPELHPYAQKNLPDARVLLRHEAKTITLLAANSDSFVPVFDIGTAHVAHPLLNSVGAATNHVVLDLPYYVMELLDGANFQKLVGDHRLNNTFLPWNIVLKLAAQTARALCIAHAKDIIHRDIKPNNIFLHRRIDRTPVVKFIDFGVSTKHGDTGMIGSGTREYGAPELLIQSRIALVEDKQSDIYPLALVIYELAALVGPFVAPVHFDRESASAFYAFAHVHSKPPVLSSYRADAPAALVGLLDSALAKKAADRPTAEEIATQLEALSGDDSGADSQISALLSAVERKRSRVSNREGNRAQTARVVAASASAPPSDVFLSHSLPNRDNRTLPMALAMGHVNGSPSHAVLEDAARSQAVLPPVALSRALVGNDTDPDGEPFFDAPPSMPQPLVPAALAPAPAALAPLAAEAPLYSSMAAVFGGWEDTRYHSSPFGEQKQLGGPRPSSASMVGPPAAPSLARPPSSAAYEPDPFARTLPVEPSSLGLRVNAQRRPQKMIERFMWIGPVIFFVIASGFGVSVLGERLSSSFAPPPAGAPAAPSTVPNPTPLTRSPQTLSPPASPVPAMRAAVPPAAPIPTPAAPAARQGSTRAPAPRASTPTATRAVSSAKLDVEPPYAKWLARPDSGIDMPSAEDLYGSP